MAVVSSAGTPEGLSSSSTSDGYMQSSSDQQQQQMLRDDGGEASSSADQAPQQHSSSGTVLSGMTKKKKKKPGMSDVDDDAANEKTGRWTDEEHTRFLHGLELFGKKWTKVADIVGTRTTVQVRSHAQKYFQKLEKDRATPNSSSQSASADRSSGAGKPPAAAASSRITVEHVSYGESRESSHKDDRSSGEPVAVPTALKRFMPDDVAASGRASAPQLAGALFKFLTPRTMPVVSSSSSDNNTCSDDEAATTVPDWYRRGGKLHELLDEADALDWQEDSGGDDRLAPEEEDEDDDADDRIANGRDRRREDAENRRQASAAGPASSVSGPIAESAALAPSPAPPMDAAGRGGSAPLSRISSFDALCNASLIVTGDHNNHAHGSGSGGSGGAAATQSGADGRKRALSQGSEGLHFDDVSLFYDDELYFDDPAAASASATNTHL